MPSEEEKEKIKNYLNNRFKDYEKNIHKLKKRWNFAKFLLECDARLGKQLENQLREICICNVPGICCA